MNRQRDRERDRERERNEESKENRDKDVNTHRKEQNATFCLLRCYFQFSTVVSLKNKKQSSNVKTPRRSRIEPSIIIL